MSGLSAAEAEKRLAANGKNKLDEGKKDSLVKRFLQQLADPMIIILLAAAAVSAVTSVLEGESPADVFIILAVVIINSVLGVYQESKAEKPSKPFRRWRRHQQSPAGRRCDYYQEEDIVVGDVDCWKPETQSRQTDVF